VLHAEMCRCDMRFLCKMCLSLFLAITLVCTLLCSSLPQVSVCRCRGCIAQVKLALMVASRGQSLSYTIVGIYSGNFCTGRNRFAWLDWTQGRQ
jgi:PhoPQ-activated pathogenicity-related protein